MKKFIITEEEKRDIVNLYYNKNIILEQSDNEPVNAKIVFEPAKYKIEDAQGIEQLNSQITNLKSKLAQRKDKNYVTKIVLTAGESQITNPKEFPKKGDLANARLGTVSEYLKKLNIPQVDIVPKKVIGVTEYKGAQDLKDPAKMEKYKSEQFFSVQIFIESRSEVFVRDFIIMKYNYDSGNPKQVGRWVTTTFNGTKGVNNIIDQTNYDYLTQNLVNNKLYTPENLYQIISNNLGEKNNSTAQSWGDIGIKPKNNYGMYYRVKIFGIKSGQDVGYTQQYMKQENQTLTLTPEQITNLTSGSPNV
jgi:hypothetical protein